MFVLFYVREHIGCTYVLVSSLSLSVCVGGINTWDVHMGCTHMFVSFVCVCMFVCVHKWSLYVFVISFSVCIHICEHIL